MLSRPALLRPAAVSRRGFTLLELIVVLLILGILAAIAIPTFNTIQRNSAVSSINTDAEAIARNANGIATSDSAAGGVVTPTILNLAAIEAYGESATAGVPVTVSAGSGRGVLTAAGTGQALVLGYTTGSYDCTVEVQIVDNKAVVPDTGTGAAACS